MNSGDSEEHIEPKGFEDYGSSKRKQNAEDEDSEVLETVSGYCLPGLEQMLNVTRACQLGGEKQQKSGHREPGKPNGRARIYAAIGCGDAAHEAQIEERRREADRQDEIEQPFSLIRFCRMAGLFAVIMHQRITFLR